MREKLLNNLPKVFMLAGIIAYPLVFFLAGIANEGWFRFAIYFPYAIASTILVLGNILLCTRTDGDGKVARWLVALTYATGFFCITLWGIFALVLITWFLPDMENSPLFIRLSYALVGGGVVGDMIAALVLIDGLKRGNLGDHIYPWIKGSGKD